MQLKETPFGPGTLFSRLFLSLFGLVLDSTKSANPEPKKTLKKALTCCLPVPIIHRTPMHRTPRMYAWILN